MKIFVGIDPGKSGHIVIIYPDNQIEKLPIPKIGKEVDVHALNRTLKIIKEEPHHILTEDLHAIFGSSASSTFSFGWVNGILEGLLVANELSFTKVQPKVWQKEMFQGIPEQRKPSKLNKKGNEVKGRIDTKVMSIMASKRLFPNFSLLPTERCRKDDDGISDSLLMAEFCRRKFK